MEINKISNEKIEVIEESVIKNTEIYTKEELENNKISLQKRIDKIDLLLTNFQ